MDELWFKGQNLGRVFHSRSARACVYTMQTGIAMKQPNLELKTQAKQLLGSPPLAFAHPGLMLP
jgi:hypothetical protein